MDSIDDDFGDLYADVELLAKSAINNAPEFTKLYTEPEPEPEPIPDNNNDNKTHNLKPNTRPEENMASESTRKASSTEGEGDDESDCEDELKIVLNDEDCKSFPVNAGCGDDGEGEDGTDHLVSDGSELNTNSNCYSLYKYMRSYGSTFPSNLRVNGSAKGDWEDNGFNHHHGLKSGQIASVRAASIANSVVPRCAYGFPFPWYRTIRDINIDTFEDKPWSHPGANITDFFNFGLNEESWKRYWSLLMWARFPFFKSSKLNQESGYEHEKVGEVARAEDIDHVGSSPKFSDREERQLELPKGRAIEVEGSMGERQPSMDVRRPRFRDSDVVIQINVQDSTEYFSGSGQEEVGHTDSNSSDHDTSTNRNLDRDQKRDVHGCGGPSDDELPADSVGTDVKNFDLASAFRRCSKKRSASNQMSLGSDTHGNGKVAEKDDYHHQNMNAHISEGMETSKKGPVGMNTRKSDSWLIEAELSLNDWEHFSLSPSSSGSDSELPKDSVHGDPAKICNLRRKSAPNSGTELQDVVTSDKYSRRNGFKIKKGDGKYYSRYRSPSEEDWKHRRGRHHCVTDRKIYPESDDNPSPLSNGKDDRKSYLRHGPFKEKWKHCHGMCFRTSEQKIHHDSGAYTSLMSDKEDLYDRNYRSIDCSGQKQRLHDCDYHNAEDFSCYRETKISSGYGSGRFGYNHVCAAHHKYPCLRYHQSFRDQTDPCGRKKRDEKEYNLERSARVDNEDDMSRNWHQCEKGLYVEEKIPLVYGKYRKLAPENSSTFKERCRKWGSKSDRLQSGNRIDDDGSLPYYHEDDFMLEKYGRQCTKRKGDSLDRTYEGGLPPTGREAKIFVQRGRYFAYPGFYLDESRPIEVENGYCRFTNHQFSVSWSYRERECYPASGGRWHDTTSSMNDVYDHKVNERYGRHRRRICDEVCRDSGWFYYDTDDTEDSIMDHDDPIHLGRIRCCWQPKRLHRMDDDLIARDQDDECFAEKASFSREQIITHKRIDAKYESQHDGILIDDEQLDHHRYNLIREGSSAKCVNRDCSILRSGNTIDFVVGQGKSSGGCPNGKSLVCNGRREKMELKLANEQTTSEEFHESDRVKAIKIGIPKNESNKTTGNWLSKYQVIEHNEDLDIEEGQIIMEEPDMPKHLEKKYVSESTVPTRNVKKRLSCSENACNVSNNVRDYDKQHILETLAKMEKRRERFKDPITFKKEMDKNPKPQADLMVDTVETKQQRPARKRRWGGS